MPSRLPNSQRGQPFRSDQMRTSTYLHLSVRAPDLAQRLVRQMAGMVIMTESDRACATRRALDELRAAMAADNDRVSDIHLWLSELHLDHCRQLGRGSKECANCLLANVCSVEWSVSKWLHILSDDELMHLWLTISDDDAKGGRGAMIAGALNARGFADLSADGEINL
jgi:hypothetical protein